MCSNYMNECTGRDGSFLVTLLSLGAMYCTSHLASASPMHRIVRCEGDRFWINVRGRCSETFYMVEIRCVRYFGMMATVGLQV